MVFVILFILMFCTQYIFVTQFTGKVRIALCLLFCLIPTGIFALAAVLLLVAYTNSNKASIS